MIAEAGTSGALSGSGVAARVSMVNTNSMNLAASAASFRRIINGADYVFADGTGLRWAARHLCARELQDNVNGTDLVPRLLGQNLGHRYYMLGGSASAIACASKEANQLFPGWSLVGHRDGYFDWDDSGKIIEEVNESEADLLLVGMGSPLQERWVDQHRHLVHASVVMAVGGLFSYWSGELERAPSWVQKLGMEWSWILLQQPEKIGRYVAGNPRFILRVGLSILKTNLEQKSASLLSGFHPQPLHRVEESA